MIYSDELDATSDGEDKRQVSDDDVFNEGSSSSASSSSFLPSGDLGFSETIDCIERVLYAGWSLFKWGRRSIKTAMKRRRKYKIPQTVGAG